MLSVLNPDQIMNFWGIQKPHSVYFLLCFLYFFLWTCILIWSSWENGLLRSFPMVQYIWQPMLFRIIFSCQYVLNIFFVVCFRSILLFPSYPIHISVCVVFGFLVCLEFIIPLESTQPSVLNINLTYKLD